jgi:HPt (histidine-containing phosphotransfer) domain-containing protein
MGQDRAMTDTASDIDTTAGEHPIDLGHLARYTGGEHTLNAEILRLFDGQVNAMVDDLHTVLAQRDARRWKEIAHTIKGAARGVGAFRMGEAAAAAEPVDLVMQTDKAEEAIARLMAEGVAVQAFIADYLAA